jgi:hypothetical protein
MTWPQMHKTHCRNTRNMNNQKQRYSSKVNNFTVIDTNDNEMYEIPKDAKELQ